MLVSNRSLGDTEALNELGDALVGQGWTSAGHCWFVQYVVLETNLSPRLTTFDLSATCSLHPLRLSTGLVRPFPLGSTCTVRRSTAPAHSISTVCSSPR